MANLLINVTDSTFVFDGAKLGGRSLFWVGGTGSWSDATNHWATSSGGSPGAGNLPTGFDNVTFDTSSSTANAAYTVTVDASSLCSNFTMNGPGASNKVTWAGSSALQINGNMNLAGGTAGITRTYTGTITFGSQLFQTITTNGVSLGGVITMDCGAGGAGTWQFADGLSNASTNLTLTNGTIDFNGQTHSLGGFVSTNSNRRVVRCSGAASITIQFSTTNAWNFTTATNLVFYCDTSTITLTGNGSGMSISVVGSSVTGQIYHNVTFSPGSNGAANSIASNQNITFDTLTFTGGNAKTQGLNFSAGHTLICNTSFTVNGNSAINRAYITSATKGSQTTIQAAAVTATNVDFQDVNATGAGNWDLHAITGNSGDAGGNTGITFTSSSTQTWSGTVSGNWSTNAWTTRVPLPQDDVVISAAFGTAQTITVDMPRLGRSIDMSAATWTTSLTFNNNVATSVFGSLTFPTGAVMATNATGGGSQMTFKGRGSYTINPNGSTFAYGFVLDCVTGTGTYTLAGNIITSNSLGFRFNSGTFDAATFNVTSTNSGTGNFVTAPTNTPRIKLGSGTWSVDGTTNIWNMGGASVIADPGTATIKYVNTTNGNVTFTGGGNVYHNIWFARGASTGSITIVGNNTFADFKDDGTGAHSLIFTVNSTTTLATWSVNGSSPNQITITSTTTGVHNLVKTGGGVVNADWLNIHHSVATPATNWFAGVNSTNNQATATAGSGWQFGILGIGNSSTNDFPTDSTAVSDTVIIEIISFINKTDSTAVSDTFTPEIISFINVTDTTPVNDSPVIVINSNQLLVSANDSTAVTDTPIIFIPILTITVTDSTAVSDTPNIFIPILKLSVTDTTAVSDSPVFEEEISFVDVGDTTVVTDSVNIFLPYLTIQVTDTVGVSDTPIFEEIIEINITDSTAVSDTPTVHLTSFINVTDTTPVTDTPIIEIIEEGINVTDTTVVTDTPIIRVFVNVVVTDTTPVTDTVRIGIIIPIVRFQGTVKLGWKFSGYSVIGVPDQNNVVSQALNKTIDLTL